MKTEIIKYDALECLESEVKRFYETNTYDPLHVTNFYVQGGCVIREAREIQEQNKRLREVRDRQTHLLKRWAEWARAHGHENGILDDTRDALLFLPNA